MANHFLQLPSNDRMWHHLSQRVFCYLVISLMTYSITAAQSPFENKNKPAPRPVRVNQELAGIEVEGAVSIPQNAILAHVKSHPHRPADPAQVRNDINALFRTGWFHSVRSVFRTTEAGPVLVFQVIERPIIKNVEYRGSKAIKKKHLAAVTGLRRRGGFSIRDNKESARRLEKFYHEKGFYFATVKLIKGGHRDDRDIVFLINEGPKVRVTKIKLEGNKFFNDAVLKLKLRTKTAILWKFSGLFDPKTIPDDILAMKEYYHSLGFFDVAIKHDLVFSKSKSSAKITYTIDEGVRYKLRKVEYVGNRIFSAGKLGENSELHSGDYFNARKMNKDVESIKERYGKLGRLFATVDAIPRFIETPGVADLVLRINEDKVYRIRKINVNIRGEYPHTRSNIVRNPLTIHPGGLADPKEIARSRSRIRGTQLFEGSGAEDVQINLEPVTQKTRTQRIFRGQSEELANPFENNNSSENNFGGTNDFYQPPPNPFRTQSSSPKTAPPIRRALRSQDASQSKSVRSNPIRRAVGSEAIDQPVQPIQQQSFTDGIQNPVNPLFQSTPQGDPFGSALSSEPPNWVDVDINATEARTGRLMFGVGVNSDAGVVGSIVLDERNFDIMRPPRTFREIIDGTALRGGGQHFRIEAIPGSDVSRYSASWTDPFFMDTNYSLGLSGFYYTRFFDDWQEERLGGRISVGRQFTPFFSLNAALRLEQVEVQNPRVPTPALLTAALGEHFLSTGKLTATYDQRNSSFLPSEGYILSAGYEQAFGDFNYPRFNVEAKSYWTVWSRPDTAGKHILSVGGEAAWTGSDTPIFENYFAGGFSSFRGFDFRGIGPDVGGVKTGGRFMALGTVEYRFPLLANEMLHGVIFSDFGTVESDARLDNFRATVGGGLRIMIPAMGPTPLAFDWAVPVTKQPTDEKRLFSFYIGFTR